ncbi:triose-phosphate isomerase [Porphyromonas uenonis]|uniref:triose-phosphate isomerase n=1 Tax=Porphyromonas uenonis TaxID=281920 RepID=UPI00288B7989|nr:triose-phosphate isomerase [Porphyromonas uenonis]
MDKRTLIVAGNWKMNMTLDAGLQLITEIKEQVAKLSNPCKVILAPPYIHLGAMKGLLAGSGIEYAAQDCSAHEAGAYTGEVSAEMIRSCGCTYVIIGHSERRAYHKESAELLAQKIDQALAHGLKVIFCVGEQQAEREANRYFEVVDEQLRGSLGHLSHEQMAQVVLAYEPVWAIGTGLTATPEQAQEMHQHIRQTVASLFDKKLADLTTILYGGSCKASNAEALFSQPDVDGGLIGGAALKADTFLPIITANK